MGVLTTSSTNRSTKQLLLSSCGLCWAYLYNISAREKEHKDRKTRKRLFLVPVFILRWFPHDLVCSPNISRDCANPKTVNRNLKINVKEIEDELLF